MLPPNGVYAGLTRVKQKTYRVALNIGVRPTLAPEAPPQRVEAYLLDFTGDLYGQELTVEIGGKLREEKKFDSLAALRRQISRDIAGLRAAD